jgi:F-type H+/Na+-transporting ATPase subunit alpha
MKNNNLSQQIADELVKRIEEFAPVSEVKRVGHVLSVGDGVAKVTGLPDAAYLELLEFEGGITGVAFNLEEDAIGAIILGNYSQIKEGQEVKSTGKLL